MTPFFSIIVPCYNQGQFLQETLESILAQKLKNWECIIINDGSIDKTEEISFDWVEKDNRFHYYRQMNLGLSSARNAGISKAKGKYILPLDADDIISPDYLLEAALAFSSNENISLIYCKAKKFGVENRDWELPAYSFKKLLLENCIFCSAIYRKSDWETSTKYDESLKNGWEDWDFWLKILTPKSIVYQIPKVLFFYRTSESSMIKNMRIEDMENVRWKIFMKHIKIYIEYFPSPITTLLKNHELKNESHILKSSTSFKMITIIFRPFSKLKRKICNQFLCKTGISNDE
ncbi:glycosyltransferase family A protein [Pedobacter agri]|uniref:glycosyltransferase family A protein n=1 Tax=Pedobacter agri TaxID=454586 RepID=UPI00292D2F1A|nr:glycosyltransferase family A protein [Pedobacter agri]